MRFTHRLSERPFMDANPFLGVVLHAIGGLAAASFYIPYKGVKGWAWENYWLLGGIFSWIFAPWIIALAVVPQTASILREAPVSALFWAWLFGAAWGIGGLTYGLTMRYLGIALGCAIALGLCAAFGTLMPPLVSGQLLDTAATTAGQITLGGVAICLFGIALSGRAGVEKEREMSAEQKQATIREFNFWKGLVVAIFAGVMSASMSYGLAAGKPIGELAVARGVPSLWQNLPVLVVVLFGGFCTNLVWCLLLIGRNRTAAHYVSLSDKCGAGWLVLNYVLCAVAGVTWYLQFFFYSMGTTKMGPYDFSSWTLHMAFIIFFSTLWGIALREWKGTSRAVHIWIALGLAVLVLSTVIIGYGNSLAVSAGGH